MLFTLKADSTISPFILSFLYSPDMELLVSLECQLCQMMVCWSTQVKGCFAKADTQKNVFLKQTQVKGCFDILDMWEDPWWRSTNMTPQTVGDEHWALVWFALPHYFLLTTCMHWFALYRGASLSSAVVTLPLKETRQRTAYEFPVTACLFSSSYGFLRTGLKLLVHMWCLPA